MGTTLISNPYIPAPQLPVGFPFFWPTEAGFPDGTLEMNGQSFSATDYPELAKIYPSLVLPDMRGVVARGLDRGSGRNSDAASALAGTYQADELKSHTGHFDTTKNGGYPSTQLYLNQTIFSTGSSSKNYDIVSGNEGVPHVVSTGGTETRGKAVLGYWLCFARTVFYDLTIEGGNAYMLGGHPASYYASKQEMQVETWVASDGNSWYRKYPDGWLEQGGYIAGTVATFPLPFISIPPQVMCCYYGASSGYRNVTNKTTTTLTINAAAGQWEAKGRWK